MNDVLKLAAFVSALCIIIFVLMVGTERLAAYKLDYIINHTDKYDTVCDEGKASVQVGGTLYRAGKRDHLCDEQPTIKGD